MTLVIESWNGKYMYGNYDGGTGRSVSQTWNCESIDSNPFSACFPSSSYGHLVYITQGCYNGLSDGDKATAKARAQGMVGTGYFEIKLWLGADGRYYDKKYFVPVGIVECWKESCFILRPDLTTDHDEHEWYDVFVDNAGYFLLFAIAGVAINEIAK